MTKTEEKIVGMLNTLTEENPYILLYKHQSSLQRELQTTISQHLEWKSVQEFAEQNKKDFIDKISIESKMLNLNGISKFPMKDRKDNALFRVYYEQPDLFEKICLNTFLEILKIVKNTSEFEKLSGLLSLSLLFGNTTSFEIFLAILFNSNGVGGLNKKADIIMEVPLDLEYEELEHSIKTYIYIPFSVKMASFSQIKRETPKINIGRNDIPLLDWRIENNKDSRYILEKSMLWKSVGEVLEISVLDLIQSLLEYKKAVVRSTFLQFLLEKYLKNNAETAEKIFTRYVAKAFYLDYCSMPVLASIWDKQDNSIQLLNTGFNFDESKIAIELTEKKQTWKKILREFSKNSPVAFTHNFKIIHDNVYVCTVESKGLFRLTQSFVFDLIQKSKQEEQVRFVLPKINLFDLLTTLQTEEYIEKDLNVDSSIKGE